MNLNLLCLTVWLQLVLKICYAAVFSDKWAVHIEGGEAVGKAIAEKHGFIFLGEIMPDIYHMQHRHVSKRSIRKSDHHHELLSKEPQVKWLEQQIIKKRVKRDNLFNDPKWTRMWYLDYEGSEREHHYRHFWYQRRGGGLDMNVKPAWKKGFTGRNVVVSILDDGIEKDHPDLKKNYDAQASYDVNGHDPDPQPRYDYTNENRHGTRCAGEVAAEANNGICSVGVAYNARIGGVRMLDGDVTDAVEAQSLSLHPQHIDIYSASWGPDDDGRTVDGPALLAKRAFEDGIKRGRKGKGSIFVWASGNGGRDGDSCNCDGYTNSIFTLSISSATENGNIPWYSEACSSTLATTYSSGSGAERQIVTTDLRKSCTETHTGTSASAPLAAGICALALEARLDMTWRDMQHIVVMTARPANLKASDWVTNAVGRRVSHSFGFGLMDAAAMVELAQNWTNVPEQHICKISYKGPNRVIKLRSKIEVYLDSDGCQYSARDKVIFLEHVQAIITLSSSRRGEVQIYLTSPHGTKSTMLQRRTRDTSTEGFTNWAFMTTHNWGETSKGRWTLTIENGDSRFGPARLREWSLVMYGTDRHPYTPTTPPPTTTTTPTPTTTPRAIPTRPTHPYIYVPRLRSRVRSRPSGPPRTRTYPPESVVKVGPCQPPHTTTTTTTQTPTTTTTTTTPRTTTTPPPPPPVRPTNVYPSPNSTAQLQAWTLVLYGTATHPQSGQNRRIDSRPQSTMPECKEGEFLLNKYCYEKCPANFYPTIENMTQPVNESEGVMGGVPEAVIQVATCGQCYTFCTMCQGPSQTDCLACANGFEYDPVEHRCSRKEVPTSKGTSILPMLSTGMALGVIMSLVISIGVFTVLQIRDNRLFCWKNKVQYVDLAKAQYGVNSVETLEKGLLDSESDESGDDEYQDSHQGHEKIQNDPNKSAPNLLQKTLL